MTENDFFSDADYNDLDVRDWDENRFRLTQGRHHVTVTKAEPFINDEGQQSAVIIEFTSTLDPNKTFSQFLNRIEPGDEQQMFGNISLRDIKRQERVDVLGALGVPKESIPTLDLKDLLGIEGWLTISPDKKKRLRFRKFEVGPRDSGPLARSGQNGDSLSGISEFAKTATTGEFGF